MEKIIVSRNIIDKANKILAKDTENDENIELCLRAKICPKCGSYLKEYRIDKIHEWWDITECSENSNHYKDSKYDC